LICHYTLAKKHPIARRELKVKVVEPELLKPFPGVLDVKLAGTPPMVILKLLSVGSMVAPWLIITSVFGDKLGVMKKTLKPDVVFTLNVKEPPL
jgi:hypothetical protein